MKIFVERKYYKNGYTIGNMFLNGQWLCNTLELAASPPAPLLKREGRYGKGCCIAPGTYRIQMYLSPRFGTRLPLLLNVPGRSGILIHAGKTAKDTQGCILVGMNTKVGRVTESRKYLKKIISAIEAAEKKKEPVVITIR